VSMEHIGAHLSIHAGVVIPFNATIVAAIQSRRPTPTIIAGWSELVQRLFMRVGPRREEVRSKFNEGRICDACRWLFDALKRAGARFAGRFRQDLNGTRRNCLAVGKAICMQASAGADARFSISLSIRSRLKLTSSPSVVWGLDSEPRPAWGCPDRGESQTGT
jgi:hypothetical protein